MTRGKIGLLLGAAAAAYGVYRLSKMTPEQRNSLKARGKNFVDKNLGGIGNVFNKKASVANGNGH
jgi:hypothetical protein